MEPLVAGCTSQHCDGCRSMCRVLYKPPSYFSGLNNFAVHHPEPTTKPRTSLHSSLQRVRDITYTSCFLSRPAMGNLQVTDEEADMLHPSHSVRKQHDHTEKLLFQCSPRKVKKSHLSHAYASAGFSQSSLCEPYWQGRSSRGVRKVILPLAEGRGRGETEMKPAEFPQALHYESHEQQSASLREFSLTPSLLLNKHLSQSLNSKHILVYSIPNTAYTYSTSRQNRQAPKKPANYFLSVFSKRCKFSLYFH